jgi:hypothetical protein
MGAKEDGRPEEGAARKRVAQHQKVALLQDIRDLDQRLRKTKALAARLQDLRARTDMREWAKARRERTRHLIELGGLIQKAGLVELVDDDRATMLGAFLEIADQLRHEKEGDERTPQQLATAWRRRGLRAFDADKEVAGPKGDKDRQAEGKTLE